ncbi:hypothetical protein SLEP1_g21789 [Rubroshorea leprosula]|uniref:Uncharacterized protein n=1 Tax=Rubroshorea leprosula TaxID=152421 RepID=A0AAV5JHX7_9ROSI|nr:hypothetical protein SLEP1_g21789 [Rubroshorea leprosula]
MEDGTEEALLDKINRKLQDPALINSSSRRIFMVPNPLREINEKAYDPLVISIGPYHYGKKHLKAMEVQKMKSLKSILDRGRENSVDKYVMALKEMEEEIRRFYSENLDHIDRQDLVEMMLLDGFFIIDFISSTNELTDFHRRNVMRDLLLVENQLPFSVLSTLHSLSMDQRGLNRDVKDIFVEAVIICFNGMVPALPIIERPRNQGIMKPPPPSEVRARDLDAKDMLGFLHDNVIRTSRRRVRSATASSPWWRRCLAWASRLPFAHRLPCLAPVRTPPRDRPVKCSASAEEPEWAPAGIYELRKWRFICSATELNEAGIKFQKKEGKLFDIEFQNGVMSIPTLIIDDYTESIFRNIVAYEQYDVGVISQPFTDYITFMDCLINTGKDVGLLCRCGVLDNWLGDHEVVATMFNRLRDSVLISAVRFHYSEIFIGVNKHCDREWNQWKANLRHNYFNTPWASISVIAAVILLLLTVLQSVYSVLAYHHPR